MCHEIENHFQSNNRDSEKFPRTGKVPGEKVVMIPSQPTAPNSGKNRVGNFMSKRCRFYSASDCGHRHQKTWWAAQKGRNERLL